MEGMKYYGLDNIVDNCSSGRINMHEPIEVSNQYQTVRSELTILKHLVILSKSENISLISILSRLRCKIKETLQSLINDNAFVRHYIDNIIQEWRLNIPASELLNDGLASCDYEQGVVFNYESFTDELNCSQQGGAKLEEIEKVLKERQGQHTPMTPEYAKQMKLRLLDLNTECNACSDRTKQHSIETMTKYKAMDPHHLQVLIDLSFKPKSAYLEFSNQFRDINDTFASFLSETNDLEIPDTIHTIFLNYLITLNMMKKEMNYISNSLKQIVVYMNPKLEILGKLVDSFTHIDSADVDTVHGPMDGEGLNSNIVVTKPETMLDTIRDKFTFF
jgi:hypothetical protein